MTNEKKAVIVSLTEKNSTLLTLKEKNLIDILRTVPYGQVVIFMENNQPVRVEQIKESIKL